MITVVDPDAARAALRAGTLSCPQNGCKGTLRAWSKARSRTVRVSGGRQVVVRPDRGRCRVCTVSQVLLPAWCLPRRAYGVEVVGAALRAAAEGAGYRRAATTVAVPTSTVRAWIRAVTRSAAGLSGAAVRVTRALGADTAACWARGPRPLTPVRAVLQALGAERAALASTTGTPALRLKGGTGTLSGIDYLALLAARRHEQLHRQLRLWDPTGAARSAPPWHQVTMITGGRLLTTTASG